MDESDPASPEDDPFADVAPPPDWDDVPFSDGEPIASAPASAPAADPASPGIASTGIASEPVAPPPLPPPVGGSDETAWSVRGQSRSELAPLISSRAASAPTVEPAPADEPAHREPEPPDEPTLREPEPPQVVPVDVPEAALGTPAPFEFPPGYFGDVEPEPEPEPEPLVDLSTRDTAGLLSNVGGPLLWIAGLGGAWFFLTRDPDPLVDPQNWPAPRPTWDALRDLAEDDAARTTVFETMKRLVGALVAGGLAGMLVGALTGRRRHLRNIFRPAVGVFRIVSPFVLLLFLFTWGGDAWWVEWAPAAVGVAALTAWSTDRALSTTRPRLTTESGPMVLRGIRASLILAWTLVFATEQALGLDGIFPAMVGTIDTMPVAVAWLAVAATAALGVDALLRLVEHLLARG